MYRACLLCRPSVDKSRTGYTPGSQGHPCLEGLQAPCFLEGATVSWKTSDLYLLPWVPTAQHRVQTASPSSRTESPKCTDSRDLASSYNGQLCLPASCWTYSHPPEIPLHPIPDEDLFVPGLWLQLPEASCDCQSNLEIPPPL